METKTAQEIAKKYKSGQVVIIASRRTDMPAFYTAELIDGLRQGVFHPQGKMQNIWEFKFAPSDIHSVGLWSQDFSKWLERRSEVNDLGYKFWYRFSILPDDPVCKPKAPAVAEQLKQLEKLVQLDMPQAVFVFIDPLIQYRKIGEQEWHCNFSEASLEPIIDKASQLGIKAVSTSILDYYPKVAKRAEKQGIEFKFLNPDNPADGQEMAEMVQRVKKVADKYHLALKTCCEKFLHTSGISQAGACVDGRYLNQIFGGGASIAVDSGQRKKYGCGCTASVDIGRYTEYGEWSHHCGHKCVQCYARG
jgi:hypothetical protein